MRARSWILSTVLGVGLGAVFVGERVVGAGRWRALTAVGAALGAAVLVLRAVRAFRRGDPRAPVERRLLWLHALGALGLLLYFAQSDLLQLVFETTLARKVPKISGTLEAMWPVVLAASLLPTVLVELGYVAVARAPKLEIRRLDDALLSGLGLAGALVFAFSVSFVAAERDTKFDLSYFRTARPGAGTKALVRALDQPLEVAIFFPPANEVGEQVDTYFADLVRESPQLKVKRLDFAVDVAQAKALGVTSNGVVTIYRAQRRDTLPVGLEIESARTKLANLDKEAQRSLLRIARPGRTVYLVSGHGERTPDPTGDTDKRPTVHDLRELLADQGYGVHDLSAAEGLAADVPKDATAVFIIGPQKALLPEELGALDRYRARGGRLLIALDPEAGQHFGDLLKPWGVLFKPTVLANDQVFGRRTYQQSDRVNLVIGSYSSHPSVTTLGRYGLRAPVIMPGAGYLEDGPRASGTSASMSIFAHQATFDDGNGNFTHDPPGEKRRSFNLGAAVTIRPKGPDKDKDKSKDKAPAPPGPVQEAEARAIVLADSDALSDGVIGNPGNQILVADALRWLVGEESLFGETATETDVPIAHTKKDDALWFYGTTFLMPALVMGVGALATRRRRTKKSEVPR